MSHNQVDRCDECGENDPSVRPVEDDRRNCLACTACVPESPRATATPSHVNEEGIEVSRSARVVMLVSVEMRPPRRGERGWHAVSGASPDEILSDVISEIEDSGPGWISNGREGREPGGLSVTVHVDWTREEVGHEHTCCP